MSSPVDIKAIFDAMNAAEEARSKPIRIHVYLDDDAPVDLVNIAHAATHASSPHATVERTPYPAPDSIPDASADMALVVAGSAGAAGKLYRSLQAVGVPVAVMAANRDALANGAIDAGYPIASDDIIAPSESASAQGLDTGDAQSMLTDLAKWIIGVFKELRLAFAYALPYVRKSLARESMQATAVQNAGIGLVAIIPGADLPLMTLNQVKMLLEIAAAYGEELSLGRVKEILAVVGAALACRGIARQVVGVVPGIGWIVKGGIGYAGTMAMGRALMEYFENDADLAACAQDVGSSLKGLPRHLNVSKGKGIAENLQSARKVLGDKGSSAANAALRNIGPAASALAGAARNATGFSKQDISALAQKLSGAVRGHRE